MSKLTITLKGIKQIEKMLQLFMNKEGTGFEFEKRPMQAGTLFRYSGSNPRIILAKNRDSNVHY